MNDVLYTYTKKWISESQSSVKIYSHPNIQKKLHRLKTNHKFICPKQPLEFIAFQNILAEEKIKCPSDPRSGESRRVCHQDWTKVVSVDDPLVLE